MRLKYYTQRAQKRTQCVISTALLKQIILDIEFPLLFLKQLMFPIRYKVQRFRFLYLNREYMSTEHKHNDKTFTL